MRHPFLTLIILFIPIAAVAAFVFFTVDISITIHDADSTGYDLTVNPDGSGQGVTANGYGDYSYFDSHTFDFKLLQDPIRVPANLWELFIKRPSCAHADSSVNIETVRYNGLTRSDVACITDQTLKTAVDVAIKASGYPKTQ